MLSTTFKHIELWQIASGNCRLLHDVVLLTHFTSHLRVFMVRRVLIRFLHSRLQGTESCEKVVISIANWRNWEFKRRIKSVHELQVPPRCNDANLFKWLLTMIHDLIKQSNDFHSQFFFVLFESSNTFNKLFCTRIEVDAEQKPWLVKQLKLHHKIAVVSFLRSKLTCSCN